MVICILFGAGNYKVKHYNSKMIMIKMSDENTNVSVDSTRDFLQSGRVGRRNALPDVLHESKCTPSTSDLNYKLQQLTTQEIDEGTNTTSNNYNQTNTGCLPSTTAS